MQLLVDYFPLLLFFIAFKWQGIFVATGVAMAASLAQILWLRLTRRRIAPVHWLSLAIITVFGGATLILQDETWIKWKPTVLYALFATILAVGRAGFGRNLIAYVMQGVTLPETVWTRVTWSWVVFFALMAVANWYVAFHYSTDTWVNFKVWGGIGLFLTFALIQGLMLARHVVPEKSQ